MTIRVVLADDHPVVRGGIRIMLEAHGDIEVVGEAHNGDEALTLVRELTPHVLLLDMEMPKKGGLEVARELAASREHAAARGPGGAEGTSPARPTRVLALSAHDDEEYIFGLLDAGASGYLTKDEAPDMIVDAVRGVAAGEDEWISARVAEKMIRRRRYELEKQSADLSPRETEVLALVGRGLTNPQLAESLFISEGTVKNHVSRIYEKLSLRTRAEAVAWAWEHGLVE